MHQIFYPRRINAKEVLIRQKDDDIIFPIAGGTAKLSGIYYEFRWSTLRREQLVRSDLNGEIQGESGESQPAEPTDDAESPCRFLVEPEIHRIVRVLWETFLHDHLFKKDYFPQSSTIQRIGHLRIWYLILQGQQGERTEKIIHHLISKVEVELWIILVEFILTVVWWIIRKMLFTEWNLGKFTDSMEFQSWKLNFRIEVCIRTAEFQVTMLCIKEVENC